MTQIKRQSAIILLYSDTYGTNIPQMFINEMDLEQWQNIPEDAKTILNDKDHEAYWEVWDEILQNAIYTDGNGDEYRLHQDGDVWILDNTRMTCEEKANFGWNVDDEDYRKEALLLALGESIEDMDDVVHERDNQFCYGPGTYLVLTDEEADEKAHDAIVESLWAFNTDFILDHVPGHFNSSAVSAFSRMQQELCEDANSLIAAMIPDVSGFVDDAISADGRGHFLASYDGEELEHGEFFIYRID